MAATPKHIQYAVEKFLSGGSAKDICSLAYKHSNNCLLLVESAGVVDELVALVVHNQPPGEGQWALHALRCLLEIGPVAQDAIARAHNGGIFTWLAGPQDYGIAYAKTDLITKLTENHPTNTRLLEAARVGDAASLTNLVCESVRSNDSTMAAIAMDMLFKTQRDNDTKWTLPPDVIAVFASIVNSDANNTDATLSTMRDQALYVLVEHLHVGEVRAALTQSPMSATDHLNVLKIETSDEVSKLIAIIRLTHIVKDDVSTACAIVEQGDVRALVDVLADAGEGILHSDLHKHCAHLLGMLVICAHSNELLSDDNIRDLRIEIDGDQTATVVASIFDGRPPPALAKLRARLGELIPFFITLIGRIVAKKDVSLLTHLTALEHLSREPSNQRFFHLQDCLMMLTKLLIDSNNAAVKTTVARILTNISFQNVQISVSIAECNAVEELISMMKSTDVKLQTATLMALRNLTNNDTNRIRLGLPRVISRLIQIISMSKAMKQKEAAIAVLGNIARIPANQKNIHHNGGLAAILEFIPATTTPQQLETAAGALWVLTEGVDEIRKKDGVDILQKAVDLHQVSQVPWTTRLLQRLMLQEEESK